MQSLDTVEITPGGLWKTKVSLREAMRLQTKAITKKKQRASQKILDEKRKDAKNTAKKAKRAEDEAYREKLNRRDRNYRARKKMARLFALLDLPQQR